jgi:integrase/recombinase XerD
LDAELSPAANSGTLSLVRIGVAEALVELRRAGRFSSPSEIACLPYRDSPYWQVLRTCRHLGIHRPDGRVCNWTARVLTRDKRYVQRCLGPALDLGRGALPIQAALALAVDWFDALEAGDLVAEARPRGRTRTVNFCPIGATYTVGHALRDYAGWSELARSAGGHYNNIVLINRHLASDLLFVPLADFNARHLRSLAVQVIERPPKYGFQAERPRTTLDSLVPDELRRRKRTYNALVSVLRMAFQMAWEGGHIESERPWRSLKRVAVNHSPRLTFLNREECQRLLACCTPALRKLVLAALYSGCRVGELAALRVRDVAHQVYGLWIAPYKRSPSHFVFLPDEGMSFFLGSCAGKAPDDLVLRSDMGMPWRRQHANLFRRAVSEAGLPRTFVFHGLRHTYASDLIRAGVPLEIVARQFGHVGSETVSKTYGHLAEQFREEEIRLKFTPLDAEQRAVADRKSVELQELWASVQTVDWRRYGERPASAHGPAKSGLRTPLEVLQVFGTDAAR